MYNGAENQKPSIVGFLRFFFSDAERTTRCTRVYIYIFFLLLFDLDDEDVIFNPSRLSKLSR